MNTKLHAITRVDMLWMELGFSDLFTSYEMELETHVHEQIEKQLGFHELPNRMVWNGILVWYDVSMLWYMLCYGMLVL